MDVPYDMSTFVRQVVTSLVPKVFLFFALYVAQVVFTYMIVKKWFKNRTQEQEDYWLRIGQELYVLVYYLMMVIFFILIFGDELPCWEKANFASHILPQHPCYQHCHTWNINIFREPITGETCALKYVDQTTLASEKFYFETQIAFYISLLLTLWIPPVRNDWKVMLTHHVITILLVGFAYISGYNTSGIFTLFTHDIVDVTLQISTLLHKFHRRTGKKIAFGVFAVSFFIFRIIVLPYISYCALIRQTVSIGWLWWPNTTLMILLCVLHA